MRTVQFLPAVLCAGVLAGTIVAVYCVHGDASPANRLRHAVLAGSIVLAGIALSLAMECVSESRSTIQRCGCCTMQDVLTERRGRVWAESRLGSLRACWLLCCCSMAPRNPCILVGIKILSPKGA